MSVEHFDSVSKIGLAFQAFTVQINCSNDITIFANSWPSASNFKSVSKSLGHFFLTVGQNNYGNKIPIQGCIAVRPLDFLRLLRDDS